MRLIVNRGNHVWSLREYYDSDIPPYAILSHTWGDDGEEVTFKDIVKGMKGKSNRYRKKPGYEKIKFCSKQAASDGLHHFWVDTCCIDKSSSTELSEAINSMFAWYKKSSKCYVYLSDVSTSGLAAKGQSSPDTWGTSFSGCRWFSRGWTLQELIAPTSVEFFSCEGDRLGSKASLETQIHSATGIPVRALRRQNLENFDVEERFSWAENRETSRQEDKAYSLLGMFNVHMPLIYGEGSQKALERLRRKIYKSSKRNRDDVENDDQKARIVAPKRPIQSPDGQDRLSEVTGHVQTPPFSDPWLQQAGEPAPICDSFGQNLHDLPQQYSYQFQARNSAPRHNTELRRSPSVSSISSVHSEVSEHDSHGNLTKKTVTTTTTIHYSGQTTDRSVLSSQASTAGLLSETLVCDCCPDMPQMFSTARGLRIHRYLRHLRCSYCQEPFTNKNEVERHQNSVHAGERTWSCAAILRYEAAFYPSTALVAQTSAISEANISSDFCGYCGEEFPSRPQPDWQRRIDHLLTIHNFAKCRETKIFYVESHFRQHLKHSHAAGFGRHMNLLVKTACEEVGNKKMVEQEQEEDQKQVNGRKDTQEFSDENEDLLIPGTEIPVRTFDDLVKYYRTPLD